MKISGHWTATVTEDGTVPEFEVHSFDCCDDTCTDVPGLAEPVTMLEGCRNCDGVKCMDCRLRHYHDGCVEDCPDCCGDVDPELRGEVTRVLHAADTWTTDLSDGELPKYAAMATAVIRRLAGEQGWKSTASVLYEQRDALMDELEQARAEVEQLRGERELQRATSKIDLAELCAQAEQLAEGNHYLYRRGETLREALEGMVSQFAGIDAWLTKPQLDALSEARAALAEEVA